MLTLGKPDNQGYAHRVMPWRAFNVHAFVLGIMVGVVVRPSMSQALRLNED